MDLQAFLKPQVMPALEKTVVLSERFRGADGKPAAFRLRGISEEENSALRRACQRPGKGLEPPRFDREGYLRKFAAACVVEPDLKNGELQRSWGVLGEEALLGAMLTAGEYARLLSAAQEVCGFTSGAEADGLKRELKNASGGGTAS